MSDTPHTARSQNLHRKPRLSKTVASNRNPLVFASLEVHQAYHLPVGALPGKWSQEMSKPRDYQAVTTVAVSRKPLPATKTLTATNNHDQAAAQHCPRLASHFKRFDQMDSIRNAGPGTTV